MGTLCVCMYAVFTVQFEAGLDGVIRAASKELFLINVDSVLSASVTLTNTPDKTSEVLYINSFYRNTYPL